MENRFESFTVLIAKINKSIKKIKTEEMNVFNLSSGHVSCLYYIYKNEGITATELSLKCAEDKANISRLLDHLEKVGLLIRIDEQNKKYNSNLVLSIEGKKIANHVCQKIDTLLEEASMGINEDDRQIMYRCLNIICKNLANICDDYYD